MLLVVILAVTAYGATRLKRDFVDFEVMRKAGARVLVAEPLYRSEDGHFQYKYLPAFAFFMIPFSLSPGEIAKPIWFAISVGLLIFFFQQSVAGLPGRQRAPATLYWLIAILMAKFVVTELVNGQCNILLGVLAMAGLDAARRGRPGLAGGIIAAAVFVKPYALVLLPWLALAVGAPAVLAFLAVCAAGLLLPIAMYGWSGNLMLLAGWYDTVTSTITPNLFHRHAISFAAIWAKWIGEGPTASWLALASGLVAFGAAAVVWRNRTAVKAPDYLEVGFLLMLVPLLSPQGWDYVLLLGAPAMLVLVDRWPNMTYGWRALTVAGFLMANLTTYDTVGQRTYMIVTTYAVVGIGAIALIASLVRVRIRGLA
jgi:hypothetical protein